MPVTVIPAQAGIQLNNAAIRIPACAGMTVVIALLASVNSTAALRLAEKPLG